MVKELTPMEYMQQQGLRKLFYVNSRHYNNSRSTFGTPSPELRLLLASKTFLLKKWKDPFARGETSHSRE